MFRAFIMVMISGENPQYKIYEKRLEYLIADKEAAHTLADEWVASIPDWEE